DITPPTVLYAHAFDSAGQLDPSRVTIVFSKPMDKDTTPDPLNWSLEVAGGGPALTLIDGQLDSTGTNLVLTTAELRDPALSYTATTQVPIPDEHGNNLPQGTVVPIATFATTLFLDDISQSWRYDQSGTDRGSSWVAPAYDDSSWLVGNVPFDANRAPGGESLCRITL